ncbi:MAG: hypothetical protein WC795_03000 [Candidatus Paceibacterota bacterium]|jgi:uncharacterized protein YjbK
MTIINSSECQLRNLLTKKQFDRLIQRFNLELFQFKCSSKTVFLDREAMLRTRFPIGTMLYSLRVEKFRPLFLKIVEEKESTVYKDYFYDSEYDELLENGRLPSADHSVVALKLQSIGIKEPLEYAGEIREESAEISLCVDIPAGVKDTKVYLENTSFPGGATEYEIVISYRKDKSGAESLLDKILSENGIDRKSVAPKMETFFNILDSHKK